MQIRRILPIRILSGRRLWYEMPNIVIETPAQTGDTSMHAY